ncbi:helix-turn-helix domain-containing protein [Colwelliaceae bacterium BS250]
MNSVLFNTHDIALLITIYVCLLFAFFLLILKKGNTRSNRFLALFLFCYAAIPVDTLINFGEAFRQYTIDLSANLFYIFGSAYWLESVFLLFYVRSLIYKNFRFKKTDILYLIPFLLYLIYEANNFYFLDYESKLSILNGYHLESEPGYTFALNLFRECFRTFCGVLCLVELRRYQAQIKNQFADIEEIDLTWLKVLVVGFLIIHILAILVTVGYISTIELSLYINYRALGLISNYAVLFLISFLIFFSLNYSTVFKGIAKENSKSIDKADVNLEQVAAITKYMEEQKPFLNHLLTLDNLAKQLHLPARNLSQVINRHFKCNFFEFINGYRIAESKRLLLAQKNRKTTMLEIMDNSGFNSKATFNTFFKKIVGKTPTQFRKDNIESL